MALPESVGVSFRAVMTGFVGAGATNPVQGAAAGEAAESHFHFDLTLSIPKLRAFADAAEHVARIDGGTVSWLPVASNAVVLPGGTYRMFVEIDGPRHKRSVLDFQFRTQDGKTFHAVGQVELRGDSDFDAAADLSRVYVMITGAASGAGVARANPFQLVEDIASVTVTGATDASVIAEGRSAFLGFVNRELTETYPHLPVLFRDQDLLTPAEWRALSLCVHVMLPPQMAAAGPTVDDVVQAQQRFIEHASDDLLVTIRRALKALGVVSPLLLGEIGAIRKFVASELANTKSMFFKVLDMVHILVVLPYFAHPKADALVGYRRPQPAPHNRKPLGVRDDVPAGAFFDVIIAGSGPAGSVLADRLAAKGKSVLLLEAGPYAYEPQVGTDELDSLARLYKGSGLQEANDQGDAEKNYGALRVLQGSCVGGGGLVNNAVCFRLPAARRARWRAAGFPVSDAQLDASYDAIAQDLGIAVASSCTSALNPTAKYLEAAWGKPGNPTLAGGPSTGFNTCLVNIETADGAGNGCLGCGLCNVTCSSERKRNALQVHLPRALANGCVLVPNAKVIELQLTPAVNGAAQRVEAVKVSVGGRAPVAVRARDVILSAGPIGSSEILLRSPQVTDLARRLGVPIGARFAANIGSPLLTFLDRPVQTPPGLQIAHYYMPKDAADGFVIETWYNPPGANAAAMSGYMATHYDRMMRYASTISAAPLVGTMPVGQVAWDGTKVQITLPMDQDLDALRRGLMFLASSFLAGGQGVKPELVLAALDGGRELRTDADVQTFGADLKSVKQLRVGTGHPQGGNAMSSDAKISVIDESFKVRGLANLRVCDGSVFPDSTGVNPQWTIMSMAHLCASMM